MALAETNVATKTGTTTSEEWRPTPAFSTLIWLTAQTPISGAITARTVLGAPAPASSPTSLAVSTV